MGDGFRLEFFDGESPQVGASPEAMWDAVCTAFGPVKALAKALDGHRRQELHDAFVDYYRGYRLDDGSVSSAPEYIIIIGQRKR